VVFRLPAERQDLLDQSSALGSDGEYFHTVLMFQAVGRKIIQHHFRQPCNGKQKIFEILGNAPAKGPMDSICDLFLSEI
jgi:hypothetical protein